MKILALNWLDLENPQAGGAEVHFFEIFGRLVTAGHSVDLVTSGWRGAPSCADVHGIRVHRCGGRHTFALSGRGLVRRLLRKTSYDVVVEDINKLPLFLPTLTTRPVYVIVPHLFGSTAFREAVWPVAAVVWAAERPIPFVYRRAAFHAISESTRDDLVVRGVAPERVRVILPGVDTTRLAPDPTVTRELVPTFLYVGRLKRYKGIETALRAVQRCRDEGLTMRLWVAGQGDDRARLERIAQRLGVSDRVDFKGFVSEDEKRALLRRAWATILPSPKEGWGITNVEAAACGTAAVASDSPGLRESVRHDETGLLVPHGDVAALAAALRRLASAPDEVARMGSRARVFAESLTWEDAATQTATHLSETTDAAARG